MMDIKKVITCLLMFIPVLGYSQTKANVSKQLEKLTVEEKIDILCADAPAIERVGMIKYDWWSECLHGVARAGKATAFPKPIAMGSAWDYDLVKRIGTAISDEARAKHHKALNEKGYSPRQFGLTFFSPTLNIARDPRWGRTSECFSEDPLLTGDMGTAFVLGLQGEDPYYLKTVATVKHFVANNEENRRAGGSAEVDEMSLREYYFPAFRQAIMKGKATSVMGAYNALNGVPCCANSMLLNDVLRDEWGFKGVVISDGSAVEKIYTHHKYASTFEEGAALALKAGCDMALRDEYRKGLRDAYSKGLISRADIDKAAARVLDLRNRLGLDDPKSGNPYTNIPYSLVEGEKHLKLALEASEKSIVLLKNEGILPLRATDNKIRKIGLIGEAFKSVYYGDYSAQPETSELLYDCLLADMGNNVKFSWIGERTDEEPIPAKYLIRAAEQAYDGILGFTGEYYEDKDMKGVPALTRQDLTLDFIPNKDEALQTYKILSACWKSNLQAPFTGRYAFSVIGSGEMEIYVDGKPVFKKRSNNQVRGNFELTLTKDKQYAIEVRCKEMKNERPLKLAWRTPFDESCETPEKIASQSDLAILFLRDDNSSEGRDRKNLQLAPAQIELIDRVVKANPNTILILGSGTPIALADIIDKPKALLNVWIGGQGEARAISHILQGKVNPSGKTSVTFFANEEQLPALDDYNVKNGRSYQYFKGDVLFPFGFGLSYTHYDYSLPRVSKHTLKRKGSIEISVDVTNSGDMDGEEVVQCYLSAPDWIKSGLKQRLAKYQRVFIRKGETKRVTFELFGEDLLRWNIDKKCWDTQSGEYIASVVPHSGVSNSVSFIYKKSK